MNRVRNWIAVEFLERRGVGVTWRGVICVCCGLGGSGEVVGRGLLWGVLGVWRECGGSVEGGRRGGGGREGGGGEGGGREIEVKSQKIKIVNIFQAKNYVLQSGMY